VRIVRSSEWARIENGLAPTHLGLIMDGNGRWAEGRGLQRIQGHRAAAAAIVATLRACAQLKIGWMTMYAFSTENWQRSPDELAFLMRFDGWLWTTEVIEELDRMDAAVYLAGNVDDPRLTPAAFDSLKHLTSAAARRDRQGPHVAFAVNYGGRDELRRAAGVAVDRHQVLSVEEDFRSLLYCPEAPDLDVVMRTGGDSRLSNFMLWRAAYAELIFTDTLWPDVRQAHIYSAVNEFQARVRPHGAMP
jgi:undecaprenyl diphosphate synthase